jgi:hypothetical protein
MLFKDQRIMKYDRLAEALVGIFAANIPSIKHPLERAFHAIAGKTVASLHSISRRGHSHQQTNRATELSQELRHTYHGAGVKYYNAMPNMPHNRLEDSEEQLTALPKACFVKQEFEVRKCHNDDYKAT